MGSASSSALPPVYTNLALPDIQPSQLDIHPQRFLDAAVRSGPGSRPETSDSLPIQIYTLYNLNISEQLFELGV